MENKVNRLVQFVDALMAVHCGFLANDALGYTMVSSTYTLFPERHEGKPRALKMGMRWMQTPTSVHVDPDWTYGADTLVSTSDLVVDNQQGLLWLKPSSTKGWSTEERANKVVLVAGFVAEEDDDGLSTAPPNLVHACAVGVRHLWDMGFDQGLQQVSHGNLSATKPQELDTDLLPPQVRAALAPYTVWGAHAG